MSVSVTNKSSCANAHKFIAFDEHTDDADRKAVAAILKIPVSRGWVIANKLDRLVLVRVDDLASSDDIATFSHVHGAVVDLDSKQVLTSSYNYPHHAELSGLSEDGLEIKTTTGLNYKLAPNTYSFSPAQDGVLLRVFKHNGVVYRSSHRKINTSRSRWGSTISFTAMYEEAGGPEDAELFSDAPSSSTSYSFLVSHPAILVVSRCPATIPTITYLGSFESGLTGDDVAPGIYKEPVSYFSESFPIGVQGTQAQTEFTFDAAVNFFNSGYHPGSNLGEAIMIQEKEGTMIKRVFMVYGPSYALRTKIRGIHQDRVYRFFELARLVHKEIDDDMVLSDEVIQTIPEYGGLSGAEVESLISMRDKLRQQYDTRQLRIFDAFIAYVWATPAPHQPTVMGAYPKLLQVRQEVTTWLIALSKTYGRGKEETIKEIAGARGLNIISESRNMAYIRTTNDSYFSVFCKTLTSFVNKEYGDTLHLLYKAMKDNQRKLAASNTSFDKAEEGQKLKY